MAASLLLAVSAAMGLGAGEAASDAASQSLLSRGWQVSGRLPCAGSAEGGYFEIEGEDFAVEAYAETPTRFLVSRLPLPGPEATCRRIPGPQFIEEIP